MDILKQIEDLRRQSDTLLLSELELWRSRYLVSEEGRLQAEADRQRLHAKFQALQGILSDYQTPPTGHSRQLSCYKQDVLDQSFEPTAQLPSKPATVDKAGSSSRDAVTTHNVASNDASLLVFNLQPPPSPPPATEPIKAPSPRPNPRFLSSSSTPTPTTPHKSLDISDISSTASSPLSSVPSSCGSSPVSPVRPLSILVSAKTTPSPSTPRPLPKILKKVFFPAFDGDEYKENPKRKATFPPKVTSWLPKPTLGQSAFVNSDEQEAFARFSKDTPLCFEAHLGHGCSRLQCTYTHRTEPLTFAEVVALRMVYEDKRRKPISNNFESTPVRSSLRLETSPKRQARIRLILGMQSPSHSKRMEAEWNRAREKEGEQAAKRRKT